MCESCNRIEASHVVVFGDDEKPWLLCARCAADAPIGGGMLVEVAVG